MKLCFMCDLHLPVFENALQYRVLQWAVENIRSKQPDGIIFAGDVTCDGNQQVYEQFLARMQELSVPFLYIPGNSDLRSPREKEREAVKKLASPCRNVLNGIPVIAVNDCERRISREAYQSLLQADEKTIVFMHHPPEALEPESREQMRKWRLEKKDTMLFYGHLHKSDREGSSISLQALDPDKAIGECPCVTYYDTDVKELRKEYFSCPVPEGLESYFGVSCYRTLEDVEFAMENRLENIELRPGCADQDTEVLAKQIEAWRRMGGRNLSVHLPDIAYAGGKVVPDAKLEKLLKLACRLQADRLTQHVPVVTVETVRNDPAALDKIAGFLAEKFNQMGHDCVIGVENMHMTAKEKPDPGRRFGYLPEECMEFMELLQKKCGHRVGINFDIGHARNNTPYSQNYQISSWLAIVGKEIVGYHIHQVTEENGVFENHMPITEVYGRLISYASLFRNWDDNTISKAPLIFEMRPDGAYQTTLDTFSRHETDLS